MDSEQEQLIKYLIEEMSGVESSIESSCESELEKGGISCLPAWENKSLAMVGINRYKGIGARIV